MWNVSPLPIRSGAWVAALGAVLALPLAAQVDPTPRPSEQATGEERGVEITYLANAGFYLRSREHAVLIDACLREPVGVYETLPGPVRNKLLNRGAPFDEAMLVLVSHEHSDHVQLRVLERLLLSNPGAHLATSPQVVALLKNGAADYTVLEKRVETVQVRRGAMSSLTEQGLQVSFFQLDHSGKGHERLVNLGHLIELGGLRILHVGDAEPSPGNFAAYGLASKGIDVAIVPYWYFGSPGGAQVLREEIRARTLIACHVPPRERESLNALLSTQFPEVILFQNPMETRTFLPAAAPATNTAQGGD